MLSLLIMTKAISLEQAIRAFALLIVALWVICVLRGLVAVAVSVLKNLAVWLAILAFVTVGAAVLVRIISKGWIQVHNNSVKQEENHE